MATQQRDAISGQLISWTFDDGVMAGKTFEHHFRDDGTVTFQCSDGSHKGSAHYDVVQLNDDVAAVSYTVDGGYTLTTVLDLRKHRLVAFSSNGKETQTQHGSFEPA
jgi:hypothetical protein